MVNFSRSCIMMMIMIIIISLFVVSDYFYNCVDVKYSGYPLDKSNFMPSWLQNPDINVTCGPSSCNPSEGQSDFSILTLLLIVLIPVLLLIPIALVIRRIIKKKTIKKKRLHFFTFFGSCKI